MVALGLLAATAASVSFNVGIILQAADARREPGVVSDSIGTQTWIVVAVWLATAAATGVIALTTEMTALQRRPATFVVPLSFAIQTFVPVMLEPIYLTERWGTAAFAGVPLFVGLTLVAIGAVAVAKTRAVSSLVGA